MNKLIFPLAGLAMTLATTAPAQTQVGFDPRQPCGQVLRSADDNQKMLVASWAFGFVAGSADDLRPVDVPNMGTLLRNLYAACGQDETVSLAGLLQKNKKSDGPGSEADAVAFLNQFLAPGADLTALTSAMAPTAADISAVYSEPLAGKLVAMYAQMFTPAARIGPKPDQNALIVVHATTGALQRGDAVLRDFPGGYDQVRGQFIADVPIVRFKFVTQGETLGLAFDGLIHVNGRWVLMPKPWRALE